MSDVITTPTKWVRLKLDEVIQTQKGKKPKELGVKSELRTIPYINIKAFEKKIITEYAPTQSAVECNEYDTLLVWDGARAGLSGKGIKGYVGSTLARIRSELTIPAFLSYFFESIFKVLNTQTKGVGIPHINPVVLNNLEFNLPPTNEQIRIVEKLDQLFSELDQGVKELQVAKTKLIQYRQSLLKSAVEGALTAKWRKDNQSQIVETGEQLLERILIERKKHWEQQKLAEFATKGKKPPKNWQDKYPQPVKPEIKDLPQLPDGWVWATIDQLALNKRYGSSSKTNDDSNGTPVLRMGNIKNGLLDYDNLKYLPNDHKEFPELLLKDGDMLFNRTNSAELVGKTAIYRDIGRAVSYASYIIGVTFSPHIRPEIAAHYINSVLGKEWVASVMNQTAGQANVNGTKLGALAVPLPPQIEQQEIITTISETFDTIERQSLAVEQSLKQAAAQRKNILKTAFSGKLVPQHNNDEPASVLLAKIKKQREEQAVLAKQTKPKRTRQAKKTETKKGSVMNTLLDVLQTEDRWIDAQEAFKMCGVVDGTQMDRVEEIYAELRNLEKQGRLVVERTGSYDQMKLVKQPQKATL